MALLQLLFPRPRAADGRARAFGDIAIAFDLDGWRLAPTCLGEALRFVWPRSTGSLELSRAGLARLITPATDGRWLAEAALRRVRAYGAAMERVGVAPHVVPSERLGIATVSGELAGLTVQAWAYCHPTGLVVLSWSGDPDDIAWAAAAKVAASARVS